MMFPRPKPSPLTSREDYRAHFDSGTPANLDDVVVTLGHRFSRWADDAGYIDSWVLGVFLVWEAAVGDPVIGAEAWWRLYSDFNDWLEGQPAGERTDIVAALVTVMDLFYHQLNLVDRIVEALEATGWPRGAKLAAVWRGDIANPPRKSLEYLLAKGEQ